MKQNLLYSLILLFIVISFNCKVNDPEAAKTGSISGKVTNDNGDSITNAIVFTIPATGTITSDSAGKFVIGDVLPGTYTIKATKTGYDTGSVVVNVIAGTITGADVKITNLGAISGRVSSTVGDTSIRNATIITLPATMQVTTDTLGRYTINNVVAGNYTVTIYKAGYDTVSVNAIVSPSKATVTDLKLTAKQYPLPALGLVVYYPFNGNANDVSGNGNNGTVNGATLTTDRFGNVNKAYYFNGTSSITTNHKPPNIFSISLWFTKEATQGNNVGVFSTYPFTTYEFYGLYYAVNGSTDWIRCDNNSLNSFHNSKLTWQHLLVISNGNNVIVYLDNAKKLEFENSTKHASTIVFGDSRFNDRFLKGKIDDIRIYNRVLTTTEVQQLYHEGGW